MNAHDLMAARRCVVIGGAGAVGAMFVELLLQSGADVCVVDIVPTPDFAAGRARFVRSDITSAGPEIAAELNEADLILLAVPETPALVAIGKLAEFVRPGALVADTLSVKAGVVASLAVLGDGVEAVSVNPMFAPSLGLQGRPIAAVVVHDGPRVSEFLRFVEGHGGRVVRLTAENHDKLTAAAQVLTHATVLAFGLALAELDVDIAELGDVAPPPHLTLLSLLARIVSGAPETYWDIQASNPHAAAAREALAHGIHRLSCLVDDDEDAEFATARAAMRDYLGRDYARYRDLCARLFEETTSSEQLRRNQ